MQISKKYKHKYVSCLPQSLERKIMREVKRNISKLILTETEKQEAIENANYSKICDLTDTINIEYVA